MEKKRGGGRGGEREEQNEKKRKCAFTRDLVILNLKEETSAEEKKPKNVPGRVWSRHRGWETSTVSG